MANWLSTERIKGGWLYQFHEHETECYSVALSITWWGQITEKALSRCYWKKNYKNLPFFQIWLLLIYLNIVNANWEQHSRILEKDCSSVAEHLFLMQSPRFKSQHSFFSSNDLLVSLFFFKYCETLWYRLEQTFLCLLLRKSLCRLFCGKAVHICLNYIMPNFSDRAGRNLSMTETWEIHCQFMKTIMN